MSKVNPDRNKVVVTSHSISVPNRNAVNTRANEFKERFTIELNSRQTEKTCVVEKTNSNKKK